MSRITEKRDVQDQLIHYLMGIGWFFIPQGELPGWRQQDEREPFLVDVLRAQLIQLNRWPPDDRRIDDLVRRLRLLPANVEGNEQYLNALRGQWTAYDPAQQREFNVTLIDYSDLNANQFHFSEEVWFQDRDRRRMDMVLYINGLPVVLVENKSPKLQDPGMEGFRQVQHTYTQAIPEFIKYPIPFAVCASRLEYGATWNPSLNAFYKWKVSGKDYGLEDLSKSFFAPEMVLRMLRDYTIFYRMDDALAKFLLRPHQIRCVEKIVARVVNGLANPDGPRTGLEWHTQGSGKTLTMIVTAHKLRRHPLLQNPTILIVVDRIELETQMCQNLEAFGLDAVRAESRAHLRHLLENDTRGVLVTTIHKFEDMPKERCTRRNVVILVDEAHRSQEGDLGIFMRAALPNAFQFGFTGTPIDRGKVGQGTFKIFGYKGDPKGVHDQYTINESIEDGTTLPLYYTLAPTNIWVDRLALESRFSELLEEFWEIVEEEGAGTQEALSRLLQRADKLMAVLKSPQRIEAITAHIAKHYQENVLPLGFKGLVVTPDREACALYKQALDQYLPSAWSTVVYSQNPKKDSALMKAYYLDEDQEKAVRRAFRDPEREPHLLIVTQKLLTGFDAPVAYVMYLDKPLRDHTLLQAIARVNRPYPNKKNGLIVDYIGVFKDLQRALAFDPGSLDRGLIDIEVLKKRFLTLLAETKEMVAPTDPDNPDGRVERLIEHFWDEERREAFFLHFKDLQMAYEVLSPDPFLYDYRDDYATIADIYTTVRHYFTSQDESRRLQDELLHKTEELIREHVEVYDVAEPLPLYPIDRNIADVIAQDHIDDRVKVINLQRSLTAFIDENIEDAPYLASIGDAVEKVIERLRQKQISVQTALEELQAKAKEAAAQREEQASSSLDDLAFALRVSLRGAQSLEYQNDQELDTLAQEIADYLLDQSDWPHSKALERRVRMELYKRLLPRMRKPVNPNRVKQVVDELLRMHRITL